MFEEEKVIGIVGGMGPQAGHTLFEKIMLYTNAKIDQQHLSVVMISFPRNIVDRTLFLEGNTSINPAFNIVSIINKLENVGAKVIGIACNTSHSPSIYNVIIEELIKKDSQVKLVNMPFETCMYIKKNHSDVRRVGLMTTNGTYRSEVYKNILLDLKYDVVIPGMKFQNDVIHKMIYDPAFGIKSNPEKITDEVRLLAEKALCFFNGKNVDAIILGCTELSLLFAVKSIKDMIIIDSTECLARALIREARNIEINKIDTKVFLSQ